MMRGAASTEVVAVMVMMLAVLNQLESAAANASLSSNKSSCNIYRGSWVYDNSYPLYDSKSCPFIERQFNCKSNGRPDQGYLKYRWQPSGCNITRNAFLVDIVGAPPKRVMKLDSISPGSLWKTADVLVFNSWHWWLHTGRKQPWDAIEYGNVTVRKMDRLVAYEKAIRTWAMWIDQNIDPSKTKVFFQGVSPDHARSNDWSKQGGNGSCIGETKPVMGPNYRAGPHPAEMVVEKVIKTMKNPARLIDVTLMSQLRKDGHPSVYGFGGHKNPDCSHWCLAGVPDSWNQLLYSELFHS
ncbi:hypothetical protein F2Q68_00024401 [Brassica cretica]|uniref:Trichome birefringence-like C-terminal domain-containing protein n=1 Tax=Brassica cretica TaxID=69181 RepID=A0A8S9IH89_BRACR|nr:hypothetical protein F2Q68_00024401 [Brassica cretica]